MVSDRDASGGSLESDADSSVRGSRLSLGSLLPSQGRSAERAQREPQASQKAARECARAHRNARVGSGAIPLPVATAPTTPTSAPSSETIPIGIRCRAPGLKARLSLASRHDEVGSGDLLTAARAADPLALLTVGGTKRRTLAHPEYAIRKVFFLAGAHCGVDAMPSI
jgi:hypothetical protein